MRKVKRTAWITVILSLFPLMLGMYYYQNLPNKMATHFNLKGVANGYLNKGVAVIGMPVLFILLDFLVIFLTMYALKRTPNSNVKFSNLLWLIPLISILTTGSIIYYNLGFAVHTTEMAMIIVGMMFMLIGNYIPTVSYQFEKQTHPFYRGTELSWNRTKRVLGKSFFFGGLLMLLIVLFSSKVAFGIMLSTLVIVIINALKK